MYVHAMLCAYTHYMWVASHFTEQHTHTYTHTNLSSFCLLLILTIHSPYIQGSPQVMLKWLVTIKAPDLMLRMCSWSVLHCILSPSSHFSHYTRTYNYAFKPMSMYVPIHVAAWILVVFLISPPRSCMFILHFFLYSSCIRMEHLKYQTRMKVLINYV